jgi:hypothetical protein
VTGALHALQRGFAQAVFTRDLERFAPAIAPGRFPPAQHLQVYRNNVAVGLTEALKAVHPAVARLVGDEFFAHAADRYIHRHPPASGNLHDFGAVFAGFLAVFDPARGLDYLPDVARLEWAWHEAFHAADAGPLDPGRLADVPADRYGVLRFHLHPSARLLVSNYPILRIWEVNQEDYSGDQTVDLDAGGDRLLIIRRRLDVLVERLSPGDHTLLAGFARGEGFERACTAALAAEPGFDIPAALRWHVTHATLTGFDPDRLRP